MGQLIMKTNSPNWPTTLLLLAAAASSPWALPARGQRSHQALPRVLTMAVPTYPSVARAAHVEGLVHIKVTTDGHSVSNAEVQDGARLLAVPAEDNVRTWQFSPHDPITFVVTYRYKLLARAKGQNSLPSVLLRLPTDVEVSAMPRETVDPAPDKTPTARFH
jgi:Gram-negative bacterial TonB protein C-terminal